MTSKRGEPFCSLFMFTSKDVVLIWPPIAWRISVLSTTTIFHYDRAVIVCSDWLQWHNNSIRPCLIIIPPHDVPPFSIIHASFVIYPAMFWVKYLLENVRHIYWKIFLKATSDTVLNYPEQTLDFCRGVFANEAGWCFYQGSLQGHLDHFVLWFKPSYM